MQAHSGVTYLVEGLGEALGEPVCPVGGARDEADGEEGLVGVVVFLAHQLPHEVPAVVHVASAGRICTFVRHLVRAVVVGVDGEW